MLTPASISEIHAEILIMRDDYETLKHNSSKDVDSIKQKIDSSISNLEKHE